MTDPGSSATGTKEERAVTMPAVMAAVAKLAASADALAAVAGRAAGVDGVEPETAAAIDAVLAAAGVPDLDALEPPQRAQVAAYVRSAFAQALDLLERPTRPAGWSYTDPVLLEGQGRGSMSIPRLIAQSGDFGEPASILDVGTGVGWLAVAAAQLWPTSSIVGIDTWAPSIERAHRNVAESGLADRIELRNESVTDLSDRDRFDLTWLPIFFVSPAAVALAFERVLTATRSGGQIVVGRYDAPPDDLANATLKLRTIRDGGSWIETHDVVDRLKAAGWADIRTLPKPAPVAPTLIAARKP